jgi:hypothetical protein
MIGDGDTRRDDGPAVGSTTATRTQEGVQATKEGIGRVAEDSRREGQRLLGEARDRVRGEADDRVRQAAGSVRDFSSQLEAMASAPDGPGGMLPDLAHQGADRLTELADRLEQGGVEGAWQDLEGMARRRPGLFLAGAFGLGMVAGRVFRNTDTDSVRRHISEEGNETVVLPSHPPTSGAGLPPTEPARTPVAPAPGLQSRPGTPDVDTGLRGSP